MVEFWRRAIDATAVRSRCAGEEASIKCVPTLQACEGPAHPCLGYGQLLLYRVTDASIWSGTERTQHSDGVRPSALSATRVWPPGKAMAGGSGLASTFMTLASLEAVLKNQKPTRSPTRKPAAGPEVYHNNT